MPSDVFVRFLERKLTSIGVRKVVPDEDDVLAQHARRVITRGLQHCAGGGKAQGGSEGGGDQAA